MSDPSQHRQYFSERRGRGPKAEPLPFESVRRLLASVFDGLREKGYFQEAFGYECVDGDSEGTLGRDPNAYFLRTIMREGIWPYWEPTSTYGGATAYFDEWDEDTTLDVVEVLHDLVSKPMNGRYHDYGNCGMHWHTFDRTEGQREYRDEVNAVLRLNDPPYEINDHGHIAESAPSEFRQLLSAPVPTGTPHDSITSRIDAAVRDFQARGATVDDRRHAVRDLADVLEAIRPDVKEAMLKEDERAIYQLANGFGIRHNKRDQRGDYDRLIWLRWAFYVYLSTIHAVLRVRASHTT